MVRCLYKRRHPTLLLPTVFVLSIHLEFSMPVVHTTVCRYTLSAIRSFRRFCKQFSKSSSCFPGQQGSYITTVELSENILQNPGNDLMAMSVSELGLVDCNFGCSFVCPILLGLMRDGLNNQRSVAKCVEHPSQSQPAGSPCRLLT